MTTQTAVRDVENECILRSRSCHWDVNGIARASPAVSSDLQILTHWTTLLASAACHQQAARGLCFGVGQLAIRASIRCPLTLISGDTTLLLRGISLKLGEVQ